MEEKTISEKESLQIITEMIAKTKDNYLGSGKIMLMWGYIAVAVSVAVWLLLATTRNGLWNWLWFAIPVVGWIGTLIIDRKEKRNHGGVKTYSDKVTSRLWTIVGLSEAAAAAVCLSFTLFLNVNCWIAMLVYSYIATPLAETAQGLIINEKSLTVGGIIGLAIGIVTLCLVSAGLKLVAVWYMPLFILGFICMMIIPGHIINSKYGNK